MTIRHKKLILAKEKKIKIKGCKKIYTQTVIKKKAEVAILIPEKLDFGAKNITGDKEVSY